MENVREAADENEVLSPPVLKRPKESKALMGSTASALSISLSLSLLRPSSCITFSALLADSSSEKGMGGSADRGWNLTTSET